MRWWKRAAIAIVAAVIADASAHAGQKTGGGRGSALTAADYIEIQQLVSRFGYALDTAAERGETFANLFTGDGVFTARTARPFDVRGRAQLAAYANGDLTHRGPDYVRDYVTNHIINPSAAGATGRVYVVWIEVGENGNPGAVQSGGHYEDVYVRTREGWRIKSRTFVPSTLGARGVYDSQRTQ